MPCRYCGEPIMWHRINGIWIPFEVSDTEDEAEMIRHDCRGLYD
jgi:hypothetical protein